MARHMIGDVFGNFWRNFHQFTCFHLEFAENVGNTFVLYCNHVEEVNFGIQLEVFEQHLYPLFKIYLEVA